MQEKRLTRRRRTDFHRDRMHEVSIATGVLDIVYAECARSGLSRVDSVNVRIGRASGIMPDALLFAFDAIKAGSIAERAVLNIEEVHVGGTCRDCGGTFETEETYVFHCPLCGGNSFTITAGRELEIVEMEGD